VWPGRWVGDGSAFVTATNGLRAGSTSDVAIVLDSGRGPVEALVATEYAEAFPALSPDSRWVA
jgi:hypothetical protein